MLNINAFALQNVPFGLAKGMLLRCKSIPFRFTAHVSYITKSINALINRALQESLIFTPFCVQTRFRAGYGHSESVKQTEFSVFITKPFIKIQAHFYSLFIRLPSVYYGCNQPRQDHADGLRTTERTNKTESTDEHTAQSRMWLMSDLSLYGINVCLTLYIICA